MRFRLALAAATVLSAPVAFTHVAQAQPVTGLYSSASLGVSIPAPTALKDRAINGTHSE